MDLFEYMRNNSMEKESPLASRLRPSTLEEIVGQKRGLDSVGKQQCAGPERFEDWKAHSQNQSDEHRRA